MRVLALDAATEACSVALLVDGAVAVRSLESGKSNATHIVRMAEELLAEGGLSLSQLDGIASSIGPGAFTGVRITVAVAQGLAFGANLRVAPVTTLEALAMQVPATADEVVLACLDARMGELYWGLFRADAATGLVAAGPSCVGPPQSIAVGAGGSYLGVGRGFLAYPELARSLGLAVAMERANALPNAREVAKLGALRLAAGHAVDPADLTPLYLRDKVAFTEAERAGR
jgi:tRNA threonylcarbamoyladenosine biosynthesis protein TsaB